MPHANVFTIRNFPIPAAPPGQFVPNVNGTSVPAGHDSWVLTIDTTGLTAGHELAEVWVQYHYTGVQLGATGLPNQGQVTNTDGTVTLITGGTFTGWINDCGAIDTNGVGTGALMTSRIDKTGATVFNAFFGCDLKRIMNAYPDATRFLIVSSPGYANVVSATFDLN